MSRLVAAAQQAAQQTPSPVPAGGIPNPISQMQPIAPSQAASGISHTLSDLYNMLASAAVWIIPGIIVIGVLVFVLGAIFGGGRGARRGILVIVCALGGYALILLAPRIVGLIQGLTGTMGGG